MRCSSTEFSNNYVVVQSLSRVQLSASPWTAAHRASLSMGFPRQEYWSGLPFASPGNLPNAGIKPLSPALAGRFFTAEPPGKPTEFCRRKQHLSLCSQIWTMVTETYNKKIYVSKYSELSSLFHNKSSIHRNGYPLKRKLKACHSLFRLLWRNTIDWVV